MSALGSCDEMERGVTEFGDVVRRNRRRHADRDALRAIGEQVRHRRRHDDRLFGVAGVIVAPVDRVFLDALHDEARHVGHARLGVAVGGGVVAVDVAEIALPLDQRIARGEVLRETHQRLVDRLIAVRVERPHHVADDLGAFLKGRAGVEPEDMHAVENAAMHGFKPVARVWQRPAHDGGERIGEIALLERLAQVDVDWDGRRSWGRRNRLGHGCGLTRRLSCGKPASESRTCELDLGDRTRKTSEVAARARGLRRRPLPGRPGARKRPAHNIVEINNLCEILHRSDTAT